MMTELIVQNIPLIMLLVGLTLLIWVFRPPYCETIDIILMLMSVLTLYILAAWGVALNYGVEVL